jgi:hypothetical protein
LGIKVNQKQNKKGKIKMNEKNKAEKSRFRPTLAFYHPNAKGTGAAVKIELRPATDDAEGSMFISMAKQLTVRNVVDAKVKYATFDWENRICIKLGFDDLCQILQVLRGECEDLKSGKGICHKSSSSMTFIKFRHVLEMGSTYCLEVSRTGLTGHSDNAENSQQFCRFNFSQSESLGLCEVIASSMDIICFGYPVSAVAAKKGSDEHAA